jgi:hypothetical protein
MIQLNLSFYFSVNIPQIALPQAKEQQEELRLRLLRKPKQPHRKCEAKAAAQAK